MGLAERGEVLAFLETIKSKLHAAIDLKNPLNISGFCT